jgi:hypothetical protein
MSLLLSLWFRIVASCALLEHCQDGLIIVGAAPTEM